LLHGAWCFTIVVLVKTFLKVVQKVECHVDDATKVQGMVVSSSAVEGVASSEDGAVVLPTRSLSSLSLLLALSLSLHSSLYVSSS
jgi:hypothetical protein